MKAQLDSNPHHHHSNVLGVRSTDAKITKAHRQNKEEENEEIKAYLNKLQEIVPFMPKHKKLSKLEVITYVIDYIRDLRETLGMPPTAARLPPIIPCMDMDVEPLSPTTPADSSPPCPWRVTTPPSPTPPPLPIPPSPVITELRSASSQHQIIVPSHPAHLAELKRFHN